MGAQASSPAECNEEQEHCIVRDELRRDPNLENENCNAWAKI